MKRRHLWVFVLFVGLLFSLSLSVCGGGGAVGKPGDEDAADGDQTDGDKPTGDDDQTDGDIPANGDIPIDDKPDGDVDGDEDGDEPDGDEPDGDEDGDEPDGDEPDGDEPDGDEPDGDEPDGDEPDGDEPDGDEPDGDEPDGDEDGDVDGDEPDGDEDGDADGDVDGDEPDLCDPDPCHGHGVCDPSDGTCECDNPNMNEDCSACLPLYVDYPDCRQDPPEGYCNYRVCWPVPPTGQTGCYNDSTGVECSAVGDIPAACGDDPPIDFCGQDAQYPDNHRSFTCYSATGAETPCADLPNVQEDEVVTDSLTGLMWQREVPSMYPGCTGGDPAGSRCTWQEAQNYCENLVYGDYSDWRLPKPHELHSLVNYGRWHPSTDITAFPGTPSEVFWSTESAETDNDATWRLYFGDGHLYRDEENPENAYVRCVRRGAEASDTGPFELFVISGEAGSEVVTDLVTDLMWQKELPSSYPDCTGGDPAGTLCAWRQALAYCEDLTYGGYSDWRLPNINELLSLANYAKRGPASDFPGMPSSGWFWSSSSYFGFPGFAWSFSTHFGTVHNGTKTIANTVRCVRLGP